MTISSNTIFSPLTFINMKTLKIAAVVAGLAIALVGSITKVSATSDQTGTIGKELAPAEGCKNAGQCGTTPGGVKLNGSWSL